MKTTLKLTIKGTSLAEMAQSALGKADQLANGMLVVFTGTFTLVADVAID